MQTPDQLIVPGSQCGSKFKPLESAVDSTFALFASQDGRSCRHMQQNAPSRRGSKRRYTQGTLPIAGTDLKV